jgi:uracil-DNA glycosylase family 4
MTGSAPSEPTPDCALCPRLAAFRAANRKAEPDWHNAPVPSFGALSARLLVVGLAPGLRGANRTGRPFTGDYAGELLYRTLARHGFATGTYGADTGDGFRLHDCRVSNAVRCVPPANKPTPAETAACRPFLAAELSAMKRLQAVLALGAIAHASVLVALGRRPARHRFRHGARHEIDGLILADSYHCSRYNTNTGRLTPDMFDRVVAALRSQIDQADRGG